MFANTEEHIHSISGIRELPQKRDCNILKCVHTSTSDTARERHDALLVPDRSCRKLDPHCFPRGKDTYSTMSVPASASGTATSKAIYAPKDYLKFGEGK